LFFCRSRVSILCFSFFFTDTSTPAIYTLSLHDALPIFLTGRITIRRTFVRMTRRFRDYPKGKRQHSHNLPPELWEKLTAAKAFADRKSTRLNSSHQIISYAVFCLKKKKKKRQNTIK